MHVEDDNPRRLSANGISKSSRVFRPWHPDKHFVIRASGLYRRFACAAKAELNFIELMLQREDLTRMELANRRVTRGG